MSTKKVTTKKRGMRRRPVSKPEIHKESIPETKQEIPIERPVIEFSQVRENENKPDEVVKEAIPPLASLNTPPEISQIPARLGTQRNPLPINDLNEIVRAFCVFFNAKHPDEIFIGNEQTIKVGKKTLKVCYATDSKDNKVQLWFDISSLSVL